MLTPMMVQYLVGLCCLTHEPSTIEVMIGDMVMDAAAMKERDVDVTVIIKSGAETTAFKAAEVKHEGKPLDVKAVEQLCIKLRDMPTVTHRAIFSTSGYTAAARRKAIAHGVDLYAFEPWERPINQDFPDFPQAATPKEFLVCGGEHLLYWINARVFMVAPQGPGSWIYDSATRVLSKNGKAHRKFSTMEDFRLEMMKRSTGILCGQEPAKTIDMVFPYGMVADNCDYEAGPAWPHTHTLDVAPERVYVEIGDQNPFQIAFMTISGHLQWRRRMPTVEFHLLRKVEDSAVFAGAAMSGIGTDDGMMWAFVFPNRGRSIKVHRVEIPEGQMNMIRKLKLRMDPPGVQKAQ